MCLENLPNSMRPEESTWASVFLDVFEPKLAYFSTLSRPDRVEYIRNGFNRMDKHLIELGYEFRVLDDDSECVLDHSDLEECPRGCGQPSCVEEETCCSEDSILLDPTTDDSTTSCSLDHPNECNPEEDFFKEVPQSDTGYETDGCGSDDDGVANIEYYGDASSERESVCDHSCVNDNGVCTNVSLYEFDSA